MYEVSRFKNDFKKFILFQKLIIHDGYTLISFNGLSFDTQVAMHCIENEGKYNDATGEQIAEGIYNFVQELFALKDDKGWNIYNIKDSPFKEVDVAAINNYNNVQKFASLKWLQYNMDWPNIMDMNCKPEDILNEAEIIELKGYCINDCLSTRELLKKCLEEIKVRKELSKHFGLKLDNLSEPKLAKAIMSDLLAKDMNVKKSEILKMQTYRKEIHLSELILPYITFTTSELIKTLGAFKKKVLNGEQLKGQFKHKVTYRGLTFSFALGGIHGAKRGLYLAEHGMIIKSFDVKSYYPNLSIRNKWAPAHFNSTIFCKRYEWFYDERLKYDKKNPLNYVFKIILNSTYGLSNEKTSFLKDSFFTMQITCNGQLLLVQLMEKICEKIPGARPLMVNTDGGEIIFPQQYEEVYDQLCKEWETMTNLVLEYEKYEKLIIWDVNNYIGIFVPYEISEEKAKTMWENAYPKPLIKKKGDKYYHYPIKLKGRFEIDKELHKNKSYRIKAIAIYNYFVHGIAIEKTVMANKNIYDFCAGIRMTKGWRVIQTCIENGEVYDVDTQKTIRYYASPRGCKLVKEHRTFCEEDFEKLDKDGNIIKTYKRGDIIIKTEKIEAGNTMEEVLIRVDPNKKFEEYVLNYQFYLNKIRQEIDSVQPLTKQQKLL
jgi:chaperonin cofactor prefoldin